MTPTGKKDPRQTVLQSVIDDLVVEGPEQFDYVSFTTFLNVYLIFN